MADLDVNSLTPSERAFLLALNELGVRFMLVGMSAALIQGARGATEDLDLWFESLSASGIAQAAGRAGGFFVTRAEPPMLGGMSERFDVVVSLSGLPTFDEEFVNAKNVTVDGVPLKVLPLERIILSKRTANRAKDKAALPALELALQVLKKLS
jgi:predicted nucleotidyltransferase